MKCSLSPFAMERPRFAWLVLVSARGLRRVAPPYAALLQAHWVSCWESRGGGSHEYTPMEPNGQAGDGEAYQNALQVLLHQFQHSLTKLCEMNTNNVKIMFPLPQEDYGTMPRIGHAIFTNSACKKVI